MERTEMDYLDFDLIVESAGEGYRARVINSPAGQATAEFAPPFSDLELDNFRLRVGLRRRGMRRVDSTQIDSVKAFGGRLFHSVFSDEVLNCLRSSLEEAERQNRRGVRLRLRLGDDPKLAELPWEYLYNPRHNHFLSLSVKTPLVRYLEQPGLLKPLAVRPPLRVLVMISSPEDDEFEPLNVEREWELLRGGVEDLEQRGLIALERLDQPTLPALQRQLQRGEYHIFHFIGHGGFDQRADEGVLVLEDEERHSRIVSARHLGALLHDEDSLRLVILNACEGARAGTEPFAGTAQGLIQRGIPAVIAMQFEISDTAALTLTQAFYTAVASGYPVDAALAEARKAIYVAGNEVEWGTPVLYMRARDGRIFDIQSLSEAERVRAQIAALEREVQEAVGAEEWDTAVARLEALLALEPAHAQASAMLREAKQRQEQLAAARKRGADARRRTGGDTGQQREYVLRARQIVNLLGEAHAAVVAEKWDLATDRLQSALALDPANEEVKARLQQVSEQRQLASLYEIASRHHEAGRLQEALSHFRRVRESGGNYKGVEAHIAAIERELAREAAEKERLAREAAIRDAAIRDAALREPTKQAAPPPPRDPRSTTLTNLTLARPGLKPYLVGAAVGAVGLFLLLIFAALESGTDEPWIEPPVASTFYPDPELPPVAAPSAPTVDPTAQHRAEILAFVRRASEAESEAFKRRDPSLLRGFYTGTILDNLRTTIQTLDAEGAHQASQLVEQRVAAVTVAPDGRSAQVEMTEVWSTEYHSNVGDVCVIRIPIHTVPQTLFLTRGSGSWLISDVVFPEGLAEPDPIPC